MRKVSPHIEENPVRITHFSAETLQPKSKWDGIFKVLKEKKKPAKQA